jgi:hypothetical protein
MEQGNPNMLLTIRRFCERKEKNHLHAYWAKDWVRSEGPIVMDGIC